MHKKFFQTSTALTVLSLGAYLVNPVRVVAMEDRNERTNYTLTVQTVDRQAEMSTSHLACSGSAVDEVFVMDNENQPSPFIRVLAGEASLVWPHTAAKVWNAPTNTIKKSVFGFMSNPELKFKKSVNCLEYRWDLSARPNSSGFLRMKLTQDDRKDEWELDLNDGLESVVGKPWDDGPNTQVRYKLDRR